MAADPPLLIGMDPKKITPLLFFRAEISRPLVVAKVAAQLPLGLRLFSRKLSQAAAAWPSAVWITPHAAPLAEPAPRRPRTPIRNLIGRPASARTAKTRIIASSSILRPL